MIIDKPSAKSSYFDTTLSVLFGNLIIVICPSLSYNGQIKSALAFYNERIDSTLSIFSAPEDTISGATPAFMVCSLPFK